jgi:TonB-linked SusC/RagA family outer membrane protein
MKLTFFLSILTISQLFATEIYSQMTKLTLKLEDITVSDALKEIENESEFFFLYSPKLIDVERKVNIDVKEETIKDILSNLFDDKVKFAVIDRQVILTPNVEPKILISVQQQKKINGTVTDKNGPIPGANVVITGTTLGAITDSDGKFSIDVPQGSKSLTVSFIGMESQEIIIGTSTKIDVTLVESAIGLDEVVVIGYGTQKKSDLTGSVTSVPFKKLEGQAFSNINQALQGKVAGAEFTSTSGEPGGQLQVRVRGQGTFSNAGPLYVIDGVPISGANINAINPNDIESISILKDASASAIYGSRAANGVILISTKKGTIGKPQLTYNGYFGLQYVSKNRYLDMANSQQLADAINDGDRNGGYAPQAAYNDPENLKTNTNWQKAAFPVAPIQDHSVNVSGGSENARYSISGGYFDQQGSMVFSSLKRYSIRVNSQFNVGKRLTIGESINMSRSKGLNLGYGTNLDLAYLLGCSPTMKLYKPQNIGGYGGPNAAETGVNNRANIVGQRDLQRHYTFDNNILGSAFAEYKILPELKYRLNLGINGDMNSSTYHLGIFQMDNRSNTVRSLSQSRNEMYEILAENTLTYEKEFKDKVLVSLLAGSTQQRALAQTMSGSKTSFPADELQVFDAGTGPSTLIGNGYEWALRSFFGRTNITLFKKYLFTATLRHDGSSRFGEKNRYGDFPSIALGWNLDQENFMKNFPTISSLKLRGSWGKLGNQEIGNYESQTTISFTPQYIFGSSQSVNAAAAILSLGNSALKWESTAQTNFGFDLGVYQNALTFSADYWIKNTDGILLRTPISSTTGISRDNGAFQNAAAVKNSGFEFIISYKHAGNSINYDLSAELSTVKNEVTSLGGVPNVINWVENVYQFGTYTITQVGLPMSSFYGYVADGIFQNQAEVDAHASQPGAQPGDIRFKDINGDEQITADDRTIIGKPFPNFTYGFSGSIFYKEFDLNIGLQGVQGKQLYNAQRAYLESMTGEFGQMATVVNRWTGEGTSTTMPRALRANRLNTRASSRFVENASYLRLQSLQIGYTLPPELINKVGIKKLRAYINGQNLLTITHYINYNPDILGGTGYNNDSMNPLAMGVDLGSVPVPAIWQFGLQVTF